MSALVVGPDETIRDRMTAAGVREELRDGSNPEIAAGMRFADDGTSRWIPRRPPPSSSPTAPRRTPPWRSKQLRPISGSSLAGRPTAAPWRTKPASYLFCSEDRALADEVQQGYAAGLSGRRDVLQSSHSPFWSRPDALAGVLADWATTTDRS